MLTFNRIRIIGFGSIYDETVIDLNPKQTILIKAPNGSGKSTIFSALSWVLYGKTLKGKSEVNTWKRYQGKDYKGTLVEVFFQRDSKVYKIVRCQNYTDVIEDGAKGKDRLLVYKDAELLNIKGKTKVQEFIVNELGMTFKLFTNSIMFGEDVQRIITESNTDKKKLFEEVFNITFLNVAKSLALEMKKGIMEKVREYSSDLASLQKQYDTSKEAYDDLREKEKNFRSSIRKKCKNLKEERTSLVKELLEVKKGYSEEKEQLVSTKLKRARKSLEEVKNKLAAARDISNTPLLDVISEVIRILEKGNSKKALEKMKVIKKAFKDIDKLSDEKDELNDAISSLQEKQRSLDKAKSKAYDLSDEIADIDSQIRDLKKEKLKVISHKYKKKAISLKKDMKKVEIGLSSSKKDVENFEWLLEDPLSNKGLKAFLFDSSLSVLNSTLESYAEVLGFRISFEVDLDSTKKDFVTIIERDNIIIGYEELSQGEKQLCDVAMAFAMNESLSASHGVNLALLDEVFEHLDDDNIDLVISLIQKVYEDKALFLITHKSSLPLSNVKTLSVVKAQGHSTLKLL